MKNRRIRQGLLVTALVLCNTVAYFFNPGKNGSEFIYGTVAAFALFSWIISILSYSNPQFGKEMRADQEELQESQHVNAARRAIKLDGSFGTSPSNGGLMNFLANPLHFIRWIILAVLFIIIGFVLQGFKVNSYYQFGALIVSFMSLLYGVYSRNKAPQFGNFQYRQFALFADHLNLLPEGRNVTFSQVEYIEHRSYREPRTSSSFETVVICTDGINNAFEWSTMLIPENNSAFQPDSFDNILGYLGFRSIGAGIIGNRFVFNPQYAPQNQALLIPLPKSVLEKNLNPFFVLAIFVLLALLGYAAFKYHWIDTSLFQRN